MKEIHSDRVKEMTAFLLDKRQVQIPFGGCHSLSVECPPQAHMFAHCIPVCGPVCEDYVTFRSGP